ncbi:hypothetical protein ACFQ5M_02720 [Agrilactobacillus yilanensis]|uniref:Uncharacterized protein n=1 Tax=Agrilactobacillus yilanensis TaxID=2485997 RepID=A0ABW4J3P2_9LACO|nr:hypothetical protein [Agrilactobacillus yilanensis]
MELKKNWYLARISEDGSDNGGTAMDTAVSSKKKKATPQPKNITSRLLNFMKDPAAKATPLADQADAGNYIYRILAGKNQAYGQLTLNQDGTYQNAVSIHAAEGVTADDSDKPVVAEYEVSTGHITNLYGKYYLQPDNLLRISYYVHGQNVDKPLPQKITLYTGSNIGLAKARIEHVSDNYLFYSKDYDPWPEETGQATAAITLTKTETSQISLSEIYQAALQQAAVWQTNSISSNADLMQVVATLADNNQDRVGTVGVNFSGSYGVSQQPADYAGVAKDGSAQATMDYVFAVSPANDTSGTAVITTTSGSLLVFGSLKNQLYLLHQPDSNSATVTWQPVKNTALTVTDVRVRLNP